MLIFHLAEVEGEDVNLGDLIKGLGSMNPNVFNVSNELLNLPPRIVIAKLMRNNEINHLLREVAEKFLEFKLKYE